ncbi:copper homeostasis protein CutC [Clostridium chrysemydis]|uniref:copper homeostasis protein CutC n=1 Tax=Clostridium chrysemydis TaxID=2665504 RepID=UPI003F356366
MTLIKECCVGNYLEAKEGFLRGANRIELCDNLLEGGTTPSIGTIKKAKEDIDIPINVIIRPRGGNFTYNEDEIEIMLEDIKVCKEIGVNGIVFGILDENGKIDIKNSKRLLEEAKGLNATFHMAFDEIKDKKEAIDILVSLGVDRILTKGGDNSALENLDTIKELIEYADGKIILMPGGGVNKDNFEYVISKTNCIEVHGTKIV